VVAGCMLIMLRLVQIRWTRTWAERGGRARATSPEAVLDSRKKLA
jgi:MFS transporter, NNP family, nitrate/nitrite transporter